MLTVVFNRLRNRTNFDFALNIAYSVNMQELTTENFKSRMKVLNDRLSKKEITIDEDGIRIVITGNQEIKEFSVEGINNATVLEKLNKAITLAQKLASEELENLS